MAAIGTHGLASVYPGPQAAKASRAAMQVFAARGGEALNTMPATPLKCAGPLKMTSPLHDRLARAGTLRASGVQFMSACGHDCIHVAPSMRAPEAVRNSHLAWKDGPCAAGGWRELDKTTLQHHPATPTGSASATSTARRVARPRPR